MLPTRSKIAATDRIIGLFPLFRAKMPVRPTTCGTELELKNLTKCGRPIARRPERSRILTRLEPIAGLWEIPPPEPDWRGLRRSE
jgi:hypothetical protein